MTRLISMWWSLAAGQGDPDEVGNSRRSCIGSPAGRCSTTSWRRRRLRPASITVVVGHQADLFRSTTRTARGSRFGVQEPQLGTGTRGPARRSPRSWRDGNVAAAVGRCAAAVDRHAGGLLRRAPGAARSATVLTATSTAPTVTAASSARRGNRANRRGERRDARRARHPGNQRGRVRVRARTAVPGRSAASRRRMRRASTT